MKRFVLPVILISLTVFDTAFASMIGTINDGASVSTILDQGRAKINNLEESVTKYLNFLEKIKQLIRDIKNNTRLKKEDSYLDLVITEIEELNADYLKAHEFLELIESIVPKSLEPSMRSYETNPKNDKRVDGFFINTDEIVRENYTTYIVALKQQVELINNIYNIVKETLENRPLVNMMPEFKPLEILEYLDSKVFTLETELYNEIDFYTILEEFYNAQYLFLGHSIKILDDFILENISSKRAQKTP